MTDRTNEWADDGATEAGPTEDPVSGDEVLLVVRREDGTEVLALPPNGASIGRGKESTIVIDETRVSRNHARIFVEGGALFVEDLGSRNGTSVDGSIVRKGRVAATGGTIVRAGSATIVLARTAHVAELPSADAVLGSDRPSPAGDVTSDVALADPEMARVFDLVRKVARTPATVLILGETGVGKEVVAEQIHQRSPRAKAPFVRVNCGAIAETLLESELFGHEKGAFTGADKRKIGYVEAANAGTLFVDEIGELSASAQVKLLRVLETRTVQRVGGTQELPVDVRVIAATHRDLQAEVQAGRFRADLYYRISPFVLRIPPLRQRTSEIALLTSLFAKRFAAQMGEAAPAFTREAMDALLGYAWPGNVRELRNAVEHALVMSEGHTVTPAHLPRDIVVPASSAPATTGGVKQELHDLERVRIEEALRSTGGNQTRAAEVLGISRRALVYKLSRYRPQRAG